MSEQPATHPLSWYADCIRRGDDPLVVLEYVAGLSHAGGKRAERERILEAMTTLPYVAQWRRSDVLDIVRRGGVAV